MLRPAENPILSIRKEFRERVMLMSDINQRQEGQLSGVQVVIDHLRKYLRKHRYTVIVKDRPSDGTQLFSDGMRSLNSDDKVDQHKST